MVEISPRELKERINNLRECAIKINLTVQIMYSTTPKKQDALSRMKVHSRFILDDLDILEGTEE